MDRHRNNIRRAIPGDVYLRLCQSRALIDDRCHERLRLEEIARTACLSQYHFIRLFKRAFDITPHKYLIKRKISVARKMLISGEYTVTDVCFEMGFESLGSFSTLFRRETGHPPVAYLSRLFMGMPVSTATFPVNFPACYVFMYRPTGSS